MLQQTQAATVVPYFQRFLKVFPTIHALAAADLQQVQRVWEGLGYYRRAKHLHRAAQKMVLERDGLFPKNQSELLAYPGFGRYTVGAVLSRAFEMRLPILETNSERVLCRLIGFAGDPKSAAGRMLLWNWAERLLPTSSIGDFNQAIMELGAVLCTPNDPQCAQCPVADHCQAKRFRRQAKIPLRGATAKTRQIDEIAVVVRKRGRILLVQRPSNGRWGGLWEFPHSTLLPNDTDEQSAPRCVKMLTGISVVPLRKLTTISHSIMNERIRIATWESRFVRGRFRSDFYTKHKWLPAEALERYPLSSPQRRLSRIVTANRSGCLNDGIE